MRNLLSRVPRSAQPLVASFVRTIFAQPDAASTRRQFDAVLAGYAGALPEGGRTLGTGARGAARVHGDRSRAP